MSFVFFFSLLALINGVCLATGIMLQKRALRGLIQETIKGEIMAAYEDLIALVNTETDAIAARIDRLLAAVAAGQAPTAAQLAELQAVSDRLKSLGQDPANPVPPAPAPAPNPAPPAPPPAA